ncbi:MAG: DUF3849 domain-containing protein [Eubacteriales bacterium]|nr:DUF3849 domain-containing protein [Eubacteriales bacterium]
MAGKREQQMKEITERLEQGVKELFTSEMYTEYLKTMSQFHNYSFNNTLLIAMQKPDATLVAGYQAWQKKFKRQVKKGEKGIQIIAPAPIREKEEIEKFDPETNEPILRPDGQPETEEVVHTIPRFRVATVFDVSQTYGEPLAELETPELMGSVENYEIFMQALREISPVPIRFDEIESGAKGFYSNANKEIVIQQGMSESQTMKTGVHETTHAKLHDREIMEELGEKKNQMTREVEAESVAYTVCQYFGLDTSDYSFPYIAGWSSSMEMKELRDSMDTIRRTAGEMIDGITEVMQRLMLEEQEKEQAEEKGEPAEKLERYQEVEFFDVPALFANERVAVESLPEGIYRYELRGSDTDPGYPITVENHVTVNHAATILTAFPLHLPEEGWLRIGDELNFTGGDMTIREYQQAIEARNRAVEQEKAENAIGRANEELYLSGKEERYAIYQIVGATKGRDYQFMGLDFVTSHDMKVDAADYGYVYGGRLSGGETLESLYEKFNINHPVGYEGHSLSVSDVVVLQREGKATAYYVDSFGFQELPDFVQERLHEAEMDRKRWYAPVTLDSDAVEIEQHEGLWHSVDKREVGDEIFYLMKHNEYGDSVAAVIVGSDGDLVAQELENGFDRGAMGAVKEYLAEKGITWEPGEQERKEWGIDGTEAAEKIMPEITSEQKAYPPLYPFNLAYAMEHAAVDEYLDSRKLSIDCKNAVEEAIRTHFDGRHLADGAVEPVLEEYGKERLAFILACTVQNNLSDGRFSRDNKAWAESIPVPENISRGIDANLDYVVNSHPAVLDGYIHIAREKFAEQERMQEQEKAEPFIARYYVVNDAYGVKAEREYQYFEDIGDALSAYSELPNHLDKQLGMESSEQPPSRMPLINCRNGFEDMEDIEFASLSGKWLNDEVTAAYNRAQFYLDNKDSDIVYELPSGKGYFYIQTTAEGDYDYTFYDKEYRELDGGSYENPDISIQEAVEELLAEEQIRLESCHVVDWDEFMEQAAEAGQKELQEKAAEFAKKSSALTGEQADVLDKIARASGMDCWFSVGEDNSYIYDLEENEKLSLKEGIQTLYEGMTSYQEYGMTVEEISVFEDLLKKMEIEVVKEELSLTSGITGPEKALGGLSRAEIEETVLCYAQAQLDEMGLEQDVKLLGARVYGSRTREGLYHDGFDVDVVLSYTGNIREDNFFNALHEDRMGMAGLTLDINPISAEKTCSLEEYMENAEKYLDDKELQKLASDIDKFSEEYDLYEYNDTVSDKEENVRQIYSDLVSGKAESIREWVAEIAADENDDLPEVVEGAKKLLTRIEQTQETGRAETADEQEEVEPIITFYVAECSEFPILGEYHERLTLQEAAELYQKIPSDRMNGLKEIGFRLEDGSIYDGNFGLMTAGKMQTEFINEIPQYRDSPLVQKAIADMEGILSEWREAEQQKKVPEDTQRKESAEQPEQTEKTDLKPLKQPEKAPEKDNSVPEGTGRKQSVLKALRERQAKLREQEQKNTEQKTQNRKKGEQEL